MKMIQTAMVFGACASLALCFPSFGDDAPPAKDATGTGKRAEKRAELREKAEAKRAAVREKIEERREGRKAELEKRREAREKMTPEERKAAWEKLTPEERKAKIEARKARREEAEKGRTGRANTVTDKREANQEKRIQHGIRKGYLTPDETAKLEQQQQNIEKMQQQFNGDGKITPVEAKDLRTALNDASFDIWTQKHDTDGNQMAAYRLGKNVFLKQEVASRLSDENLARADARRFLGDFRSLTELKRKLNGDLTDEERAKLQARYDDLLNQYFTTK